MNRRHALKALAGLALCPLCAPKGFAAEGSHWSYEGNSGPSHWGDADAANQACAVGAQQSPIDIRNSVNARLPQLRIGWHTKPDMIVNNGHTIQVNSGPNNTLAVGNDRYTLLQYHFHHPSEHLIAGRSHPMEIHFVHRNEAGSLAVVGVLVRAGKVNPAFRQVISAMPPQAGEPVKMTPADPKLMLPAQLHYYNYAGSLTTPPCSEVVNWFLLREPIQVAQADIDAFARLYPMNARPVQNGNRRFVLSS